MCWWFNLLPASKNIGDDQILLAGYDILMLVVTNDAEVPVVTNIYRNTTGTNFKFTASDNWNLYSVDNPSGKKLMDLVNTQVTTNMLDCGHQTSITVQDLAGNKTTVKEEDMIVDSTPPSVSVTYTDGKYILTLSDNESGVWKITNGDGTMIYKDYSLST